MRSYNRNTIVIVDNVDIDNLLAGLSACHPSLGLNLRAVIVTGRPAHPDRTAGIRKLDQGYSKEVLRLNTRRMKGFLLRMGWNVPVFEGLIPPQTLVPHSVHIDEHCLDLNNDYRHARSDGTFGQAIEFLAALEGPIDIIVGGPLTETKAIMRELGGAVELRRLVCQLGLFGFSNVVTMAGKGRTFNSAADPNATRAVLAAWPGEVYMVPTDVTKNPAVGFATPQDFRRQHPNIPDLVVRLYQVFWQAALEPRGERIYPHDVHPVFLAAQLRGTLHTPLYSWEAIRVNGVGRYGEIDAVFGQTSTRFVAKTVQPDVFMDLFAATIRAR